VGVDAEGEAGIGVAEIIGDGTDGLAGVDEFAVFGLVGAIALVVQMLFDRRH